MLRRHRLARLRRHRQACSTDRARQDQARGQGQARRAARRDQGRHPHTSHLHRQAVRHGLARLARARSAHHGHLSRPGREVDLPEDRRQEAGGVQGHRRGAVPQGRRQGAQQGIAGEDQEHAGQIYSPSAEVRPHRQERRRACRLATRSARAPVARHDRRAGQQGAQVRGRPADRLRQGREGEPGQVRGDPRGHRDRRASVRHLDAPGRSHHGDRHRSRHDHLPLLPRGTRSRCRH